MLFLVSVVAGFVVWPGYAAVPNAPQVAGGVLIMHDHVETDGGSRYVGLRATVEAQQWETGVPDVSMLQLDVKFEAPIADHRWYVVASGDYGVVQGLPLSLYCHLAAGQPSAGGGVACPGGDLSQEMEFEFGRELGFHGGSNTITSSIVDLDGYDRRDVTVVSGLVPDPDPDTGEVAVTIQLPIATPAKATVSGKEFVRYGAIGFSDWEWGASVPLAQGCTLEPPVKTADVVLMSTCVPLERVIVTSTAFDTGLDVGARAVEYSSPDVVSDDRVTWIVDGSFPGGQALLNDPFAEGQETQRSFVAGLLISLGVSFLVLLIEEWLGSPRRKGASLGGE
ncbi:hypothetical protein [Promicromonospora sp. AC04]|uniref:hypothetical protein n=1 Tax=Promicromonospora sp. AC04 TaxID=2135723 RepID=UPI001E5E6292|nr:hypothetical protein [Promicromonospora sp. AC04]